MKNPFYYTPGDRRALLFLSALAIISLVCLFLFGNEEKEQSTLPLSDTLAVAASCQPQATADTASFSTFDPNTVDSSSLAALGITPGKIHIFLNYRRAGAVFRRPSDIARCYSFSDADIDRLLPLIDISPRYARLQQREKYPISQSVAPNRFHQSGEKADTLLPSGKFTTFASVDINTADTALLMRVPGVGQAIASMIIDLRNKFGGFTSISQLSSIRYLTPETVHWFAVGPSPSLRKININHASFKTLVTHPYINREQANSVLRYIRLYGPISSSDTLLSTSIFTPREIEQLLPYLDFSD